MNTHYEKLDEEYKELQKEFKHAVKIKCTHCINRIVKRMTEIDIEQAKILQEPLDSRPELSLNVR